MRLATLEQNVQKWRTRLGHVRIGIYHSGLADRLDRLAQFRSGQIDVLFCTSGFGQGIDLPNISFVIHYNMPASITAYYQQTGRGGRNASEPCECVLFFDCDMFYYKMYYWRNLVSLAKVHTAQKIKEVVDSQLGSNGCGKTAAATPSGSCPAGTSKADEGSSEALGRECIRQMFLERLHEASRKHTQADTFFLSTIDFTVFYGSPCGCRVASISSQWFVVKVPWSEKDNMDIATILSGKRLDGNSVVHCPFSLINEENVL